MHTALAILAIRMTIPLNVKYKKVVCYMLSSNHCCAPTTPQLAVV